MTASVKRLIRSRPTSKTVELGKVPLDLARRQGPRAQGENLVVEVSSKPSNRRWPLRTSCGSKQPLRSLGVSISTGPSVATALAVQPLRVLPVPPAAPVSLVAEILAQLRLQRPLDHPLPQLQEHPARPDDLLLATGARKSPSITSSDSRSRTSPRSSGAGAPPAGRSARPPGSPCQVVISS